MLLLRGQRGGCCIRTIALKDSLATLIQRFALALLHHLFQQAPHGFYPIHQGVEFREFLPGESSPAFRSPGDVTETEKQLADFVKRKTKLARALDDCQAIEHGGVVASLAAHSHGRGEQPDSLIVADRRSVKPDLPGYFGNRQWGHGNILRSRQSDCQFKLTNKPANNACLKVDFKLHRAHRRLVRRTKHSAWRKNI
jgi:hypothetical protein